MFGTIYSSDNSCVVTIDDVCELITDGTHQTPTYTTIDNGYKFLSSKNVTKECIDWSDIMYIPEDLHNQLYRRLAPKRNDILLAKNGTIGFAAIVDTDDIFDIYVSLALLRPKKIINPIYLLCAVNNSVTREQFFESIKGIGVPNLHLNMIKKTKILNPPIELQNEFADFVNDCDKLKFEINSTTNSITDKSTTMK